MAQVANTGGIEMKQIWWKENVNIHYPRLIST